MERSETINELAAALAKAQATIDAASKDTTNPHFGKTYADLASVWRACREPLTANGLAVSQLPSAEGSKVTVRTVLMHQTGQFLCSDLTLTATKNDPQGVGSAITYARRYALAAIVGVAPDDDDDGNAASAKPASEPRQERQRPPEKPPEPAKPADGPQLTKFKAALRSLGCASQADANIVVRFLSPTLPDGSPLIPGLIAVGESQAEVLLGKIQEGYAAGLSKDTLLATAREAQKEVAQ